MFLKYSRRYSFVTCGLLLAAVAGCSGSDLPDSFKARFVYSDRTEGLMREAQDGVKEHPGVKELLDERFGDPQHLLAWSQLPIEFGGVSCKVTQVPDGEKIKDLYLEIDGELVIEEDQTVIAQFVTGNAAPAVVEISKWRSEEGKANLKGNLEVPPAVGDVLIIGAGERLQSGRALYMQHCSHCHGTSGDGDGPTAEYLYPRPRDYRHGVFKFTSTKPQSKVSRDDLTRVLRNGVAGTYMPSFVPMLDEAQLEDVVEYVRFLSMRGEFERKLAGELSADYSKDAVESRKADGESYKDIVAELTDFLAEDMVDSLEFVSDDLANSWTEADTEDALIIPGSARVPDSPESRRMGRELYLSKAINCADCHGIAGYGNGPQTTIYEKNPVTQELYSEPGLHDVWDNINQPRNLTYGIYRGGRRPIDLYRRIYAGIKGSRMPSFKNLTDEQIWHIVNYVLSIPFEPEPGHAPLPGSDVATASNN